jgi:hypothetical protein
MICEYEDTKFKEVAKLIKGYAETQCIGAIYKKKYCYDVVIYTRDTFISIANSVDNGLNPFTLNDYKLVGFMLGTCNSIVKDVETINSVCKDLRGVVWSEIVNAFDNNDLKDAICNNDDTYSDIAKAIYNFAYKEACKKVNGRIVNISKSSDLIAVRKDTHSILSPSMTKD